MFLIYRWRFFELGGVSRKSLALFFLIKLASGLLLTLIYTYYYTDTSKSDIYRYFNDSRIVSSVLFSNPVAWLKIISGIGTYDSDAFSYLLGTQHFSHPAGDLVTSNSFFIRIVSLLNYLSISNIYIDTLLLDFISFIGFTMLFKVFAPYIGVNKKILCVPIYLLPSVVFWSSGLLKESLLFTGIALYLYGWIKGNDNRTWLRTLMIVSGILVVTLIKIYIAILLVVCSLFLPLRMSSTDSSFPVLRRLMIWFFIGFMIWYNLGGSVCEKIIYKRDEFILLAIAENAGSTLDKNLAEPTCDNLLSIIPSSVETALFKPFVWQQGPLFQMVFAVENLVLFAVLAILLITCFKLPEGEKLLMAVFCFTFSALNYLVIGVTIPVMGAIVHYRASAIPFLALAVLLFVDTDKLANRLKIRL
jgi:hypothetical protein